MHVKWNSPTNEYSKLNSDEACSIPNQKRGFGGVIRDSTGKWLLEYMGTRPMRKHSYMELTALQESLRLALQHNTTSLEVNVDSTEVISLLGSLNSHYSSLIHECRYLLHQLDRPWVIHTYREQNQVANKLAKYGATLDHNAPTTGFVQPPSFKIQELLADHRGTLHKRTTHTTVQLEHLSFCLDMLAISCNSNHVLFGNATQIGVSDQPYF
ncbi:hypothetical protein A4A49_59477, partial [Nicotiana attenuata]